MYKVNEVFETIQGEGSYTGIAAIFVRLQGCPVGCSWCDTKHTWAVKDELRQSLGDIVIKTAETEYWAGISAEQLLALFAKQGYQAKHRYYPIPQAAIDAANGILVQNPDY